MGHIVGYSLLDHIRSEETFKELRTEPVKKKLAQYKQKWFNHVSKMENIRHPKQLLVIRPIGRRPGQPLKRLLDGYSREAETGHLLA